MLAPIVSTDWLHSHLNDPQLSIVDGSWYLPNMQRDGRSEFDARHIPGAVFFDIDVITEPNSPLPHTLASAENFARMAGALGISDQDTIVVYDGMGLFSAPRVRWNFQVMGARNVAILDGGLPQWLRDGLPVQNGAHTKPAKRFDAVFDDSKVVSFDQMRDLVDQAHMQIADARPPGRFSGAEAEPRPGVRSGHMAGARNIPFASLAKDGRLLPSEELKQVFEAANISPGAPVVTTCGSGVTAAVLSLALETMGHNNHVLYDGSWAEWGSRDDTQVISDT